MGGLGIVDAMNVEDKIMSPAHKQNKRRVNGDASFVFDLNNLYMIVADPTSDIEPLKLCVMVMAICSGSGLICMVLLE